MADAIPKLCYLDQHETQNDTDLYETIVLTGKLTSVVVLKLGD